MGNTIWVEVHGRPIKETADDSSTMHRLMGNLDVLAGKLGVRKLSEFYDYSELEETYDDLGDEGGDIGDDEEEPAPEPTLEERQAKGEWFDSAVGLDSVRKLRQRLAERFDDLDFKPDRSTAHWPKQLLDELIRIPENFCSPQTPDFQAAGRRCGDSLSGIRMTRRVFSSPSGRCRDPDGTSESRRDV